MDNITIGDIYYDSAEVMPRWYWLLLINHISETEAAVQSLIAEADAEANKEP